MVLCNSSKQNKYLFVYDDNLSACDEQLWGKESHVWYSFYKHYFGFSALEVQWLVCNIHVNRADHKYEKRVKYHMPNFVWT